MFMGFTLHFYIILGTNLVTGGPARIAVFFAYFRVSKKRNIKRSPNGMKPLGAIFLEQMPTRRLEVDVKQQMRQPRGCPARPLGVGAPHPRGPLVAQPTYFFLLYISTYPENIQGHHENQIPPSQPSVSTRSHLGAFVGAPLEGESTMEGLYIISKASPMSCG